MTREVAYKQRIFVEFRQGNIACLDHDTLACQSVRFEILGVNHIYIHL